MNDINNKKEIKKEKQDRKESNKKVKEVLIWVISLGLVGYAIFWVMTLPKLPQTAVISQSGIHWHPNISITIKGEKIEIPAGIGIGAVHNPMHTHEADGTVHMEYGGIVREKDTRVGNFFKVWGKDFDATGIMGNKVGVGGGMIMMVNGVENTEFDNYLMKDGDKIEIIFE